MSGDHELQDFSLYQYRSYEEYREVQIHFNKKKIDLVWADEGTLDRVFSIVDRRIHRDRIKGLCHGSRNGFEQLYLNALSPRMDVIGTDISETALDYPNSVQWDFHDTRDEWLGTFDFVYSNSLDQSWKPARALEAWLGQISDDGVVIIEHTEDHGPRAAGRMDPFGVRPVVMPYVLTLWFGEQISISHSVRPKANMDNLNAWLFVVSKNVSAVKAQDYELPGPA